MTVLEEAAAWPNWVVVTWPESELPLITCMAQDKASAERYAAMCLPPSVVVGRPAISTAEKKEKRQLRNDQP